MDDYQRELFLFFKLQPCLDELERVTQSGMLEKKGPKNKGWKKRYFALCDNYLFYFENSKFKGVIALKDCKVKNVGCCHNRDHVIEIKTKYPRRPSKKPTESNCTFHVAASSAYDSSKWEAIVQEASKFEAQKDSESLAAAICSRQNDMRSSKK